MNVPRMYKIIKTKKENPTTTTLVFDCDFKAKSGQFVNLWIPRLNEKPMSIAFSNGKELHLTIADVGPFSHAANQLKKGDQAGLRGPYGTHFTWKPRQRLVMIGGGFGVAPLYFTAYLAVKDACKVDFIIGARKKDLLIYTDQVKKLKSTKLHTATNDGSVGHKGFNIEILRKLLMKNKYDMIYTCGPEMMMVAVAKIAEQYEIDTQLSLERYMKCGFGLCGQCVVDPLGDTMCTKGTVVSLSYVKKVTEFGKYHRDALGKKHNF